MDLAPTEQELAEKKAASFYHVIAAEYMELIRDKRPASQLARQQPRLPNYQMKEGDLPVGTELTPWCPIEQSGHAGPVCAVVTLDQYVAKRVASATDEELAQYGLVRDLTIEQQQVQQAIERTAFEAELAVQHKATHEAVRGSGS